MDFKLGMLSDERVVAFLNEHIEDMLSVSPPESKHALDATGLQAETVRFWTLWEGDELLVCGALQSLGPNQAELKSMRTAKSHRGRGLARKMLHFLIKEAKEAGHQALYLETGSMPFFEAARNLYQCEGFEPCPPFGAYQEDPNSVFMYKAIS